MHFYTYKITNLLNGKIYVGVHKTSDLNDDYMGSGKILKHAINKHGIENFKKEILMFHESEYEMFEIEELIVDQHFVDRKDTYNLKLGGNGGFDYINSSNKWFYGYNGKHENSLKALKNNLSKHHDKMKSDIKYRHLVVSKLSKHMKIKHANGFFKAKKHSDETKEKLKQTFQLINHQQGKNNSQFGTVWIHNLKLKKSKKISKNDKLPDGWEYGYVLNWDFLDKCCEICGKNLNLKKKSKRKYCKEHANKKSNTTNELLAKSTFEEFKRGGYSSIRDYAKNSNVGLSHVTLSKIWKQYIPK